MIHNAIYGSQIIDFTKRKFRQHLNPRVAEFFLTKLGEKIFSLNCTINWISCVIGKASKRQLLMCKIRQTLGDGFPRVTRFYKPVPRSIYMWHMLGIQESRIFLNLAEILPSVGRKFRQSPLQYRKPNSLFLSPF